MVSTGCLSDRATCERPTRATSGLAVPTFERHERHTPLLPLKPYLHNNHTLPLYRSFRSFRSLKSNKDKGFLVSDLPERPSDIKETL